MSTEKMSCKLAESEKIERAKAATEMVAEYREKEDRRKLHAKAEGDELKTLRSKLEEASRAAREGWEYREIETDVRPNVATREIETFRLDTLERIRVRRMTADEEERYLQTSLRMD